MMEVYLFQNAGSHEWNGSHGTDRWLAASENARPRTRGLDVKHRMWQPKTVDFMNNDGFITNITADFWGPTSFRSDCVWLTQCCTEWSMVDCGSQSSRARGVGGLTSHKFCIFILPFTYLSLRLLCWTMASVFDLLVREVVIHYTCPQGWVPPYKLVYKLINAINYRYSYREP